MSEESPQKVKPILTFFGEYRFLSNFWYAPFTWEGVAWESTEQAYQAAKAPKELWQYFANMTPGEAKKAGKGNFRTKHLNENKEVYYVDHSFVLREDWEDVKYNLMYQIVREKFKQNPALANKLMETGDAILEEGNTWGDRIWGVSPPGSGKGSNWLGKILMKVRQELLMGFE